MVCSSLQAELPSPGRQNYGGKGKTSARLTGSGNPASVTPADTGWSEFHCLSEGYCPSLPSIVLLPEWGISDT